ncbi:MAG: endo-1,4-beta-xylanase [Clostridiales bacterium]|nr:endo-1,4-beta-xylanase [Clostridiales bacterium]
MSDLSARKAKANIVLLTEDKRPLSDTDIRITQKTHEFLFGCGAFDAVGYALVDDPAKKALIKERLDKWTALFNFGTLPFYWGSYEPVEGQPNEKALRDAADYLVSKGARVKGHPLCWHTVCADWLLKYSNEEIMRKQLARIDREVTGFKGLVDMWDVINEVVIMPVFDKYDNAVTRLCNYKGRIGLVKEVFDEARKCNPGATLLINDFNTSPAYEKLLDELLDAGVVPDAIGIQSHQHQGYWGLAKLNDVLERFSRFGIPIHFTENTLISGDIMPADIEDLNDYQVETWPSTEEGEARQAKEICEMYETLFSHPLVEAITTWDLTDDCWLHAPAGVLRSDNTPKPSYNALMDLIHGKWETHLTLRTDADGRIIFDGFKGDYELTAPDGKTVTFSLKEDVKGVFTI